MFPKNRIYSDKKKKDKKVTVEVGIKYIYKN